MSQQPTQPAITAEDRAKFNALYDERKAQDDALVKEQILRTWCALNAFDLEDPSTWDHKTRAVHAATSRMRWDMAAVRTDRFKRPDGDPDEQPPGEISWTSDLPGGVKVLTVIRNGMAEEAVTDGAGKTMLCGPRPLTSAERAVLRESQSGR